jgi:hypothetical protein
LRFSAAWSGVAANIDESAFARAVSSRGDFLFSGKEDELFMQEVYSYGTGPE